MSMYKTLKLNGIFYCKIMSHYASGQPRDLLSDRRAVGLSSIVALFI